MTPDDVERMCQEAIANGADPVQLARLKAEAIVECGGTMASLAREWTIRERLESFERAIGLPAPRERELDQMRHVMAKYPGEAEKMLAALQKIQEQRGEG